jgi:hypothetical protein
VPHARLVERPVDEGAIALGPYPAGQPYPKPGTPLFQGYSDFLGRTGVEPLVGPEPVPRFGCGRGHSRHCRQRIDGRCGSAG